MPQETYLGLDEAENDVRHFHEVMIGPQVVPDSPVRLDRYNGELRCSLIDEEASEFRRAWEARDRFGMIDALCDLMYVTLGAGVEMGVDLSPFFAEVHACNMRKAGGRIRDDGKQLKPDGWSPPDIEEVYRRLYGAPPTGEPRQETLPLQDGRLT